MRKRASRAIPYVLTLVWAVAIYRLDWSAWWAVAGGCIIGAVDSICRAAIRWVRHDQYIERLTAVIEGRDCI